MAALALVGAMVSSCSEEIEVVQPANTGKTVMVKTTVSLGENATTRALTIAGVKTFAVGEQIAVIYENTSNQTVKAVSFALTDDDIDKNTNAHNATFSVPLTNPKPGGDVRYIYPASMAADDVSATTPYNDATIKWTNLTTQDGTFASLASNLDLATFDGNLTESGTLPATALLANPLTIGKFTISSGDADVTGDMRGLNISDGTNTYAVTTTTALSTFYVAMQPISDTQTVVVQATDGTTHYVKTVTGKTLAKNKITPVNVKMFTGTPASSALPANLGYFLGADGFIYANTADATATGTTAVAVIAYVGSVSNYFDKFLAIALTDVDYSEHTWGNALTKVGEYAADHPITIGGTIYNCNAIGATCYDIVADDVNASSATRTTGVVKGWRLPSVTDWRYIFDGLGRQKASLTLVAKRLGGVTTFSEDATPTDPNGVEEGMLYRNGSNGSSLRNAINTACGNDAMHYSRHYYYSSSQLSSISERAWVYFFTDGQFTYYAKTNPYYVRAVFAY